MSSWTLTSREEAPLLSEVETSCDAVADWDEEEGGKCDESLIASVVSCGEAEVGRMADDFSCGEAEEEAEISSMANSSIRVLSFRLFFFFCSLSFISDIVKFVETNNLLLMKMNFEIVS